MEVATRRQDHAVIVELTGDWELGQEIPDFEAVLGESQPTSETTQEIGFDADDLGTWDSSLLAFLVQGLRYSEAHDLDFKDDTLPDDIARLIELSRAVPEQDVEKNDESSSRLDRLGESGLAFYESTRSSLTFLGQVVISIARLVTLQGRMRWRDFWLVMQSNSSGALGIVALISFLAGLIIAFLGAVVLQRFGAGYYVSYLVSYGMLRELGALMTGIIMTGRTGAAFAAELGSMKISEELDAFRTLGISPIDYLVVPRILALFLMMPLLTIYADFIGIAGGLAVAVTMLDLTPTQFMTGLLEPVALTDALLGIFKATLYGLIIGVSGCLRGMQTGDDAGAVGKAATSAVVTGITLIILTNAIVDWAAALLGI
jgi:phospholipid/cholesterol/gamma-HCH transport system permease protein